MERVFLDIPTNLYMLEDGSKENSMARVNLHGLMDLTTKETT